MTSLGLAGLDSSGGLQGTGAVSQLSGPLAWVVQGRGRGVVCDSEIRRSLTGKIEASGTVILTKTQHIHLTPFI